jgi:hypothetical protein
MWWISFHIKEEDFEPPIVSTHDVISYFRMFIANKLVNKLNTSCGTLKCKQNFAIGPILNPIHALTHCFSMIHFPLRLSCQIFVTLLFRYACYMSRWFIVFDLFAGRRVQAIELLTVWIFLMCLGWRFVDSDSSPSLRGPTWREECPTPPPDFSD